MARSGISHWQRERETALRAAGDPDRVLVSDERVYRRMHPRAKPRGGVGIVRGHRMRHMRAADERLIEPFVYDPENDFVGVVGFKNDFEDDNEQCPNRVLGLSHETTRMDNPGFVRCTHCGGQRQYIE